MTIEQAGSIGDYAKTLFPVTTQERIDSLSVAMLKFDNPDLARQILLKHSHESDKLNIPGIVALLDADHRRRNPPPSPTRAMESLHDRGIRQFWEKVDEALKDFTDEDLADLRDAVAKDYPEKLQWLKTANPRRNRKVRADIYAYLMSGVNANAS